MTIKHHHVSPDEATFEHVVALKAVGVCLGIAGLVWLISLFFTGSSAEKVETDVTVPVEIDGGLLQELTRLRTTWDTRQRQRILDAAPAHGAAFRDSLLRLLTMHDHQLLEQAAEYAGALGEATLRPALVAVVESDAEVSPGARYQAVLAAERLSSWSHNRLAGLLASESDAIDLAALSIVTGRDDAPWPQVVALLADDDVDAAVRRAAVQAIPAELPPALLQEIWNVIQHGGNEGVLVGFAALARTKLDADLENRLTGLLENLEGDLKLECLGLLGNRGEALRQPGVIWTLVTDSQEELRIRARALYCLEQTRSFDVPRVSTTELSKPVLQYFAARCLLADGQKAGLESLLALVDSDAAEAALASRRLLAWLTGHSPSSSRAEFASRLDRAAQELQSRQLPAPSYEFGG